MTQPVQVWLTYVDDTDGGSRENWSVFYCEPTITTSEVRAKEEAKKMITKLATEIWDDNGRSEPLSEYETMFSSHIVGPVSIV